QHLGGIPSVVAMEPDPRVVAYEADLRSLIELVDVVLVEQCGTEVASRIRDVREGRGDVGDLDLAGASTLARTVSTVFHLADLVELRQRDSRRATSPVASAVGGLAERGVAADEVRRLLERLTVRPVFTAHPTEARRQTILRHLEH